MVAGGLPGPSGRRLRCAAMYGARATFVGACLVVGVLAACHGGGTPRLGSTPAKPDVKAACASLAGLQRSSDALNGVDVADPQASLTALQKAIDAYDAALARFALVGPAGLRVPADAVRADVVARHFTQAAQARAPIDAWAATHCS
jgi:hypothetical protein